MALIMLIDKISEALDKGELAIGVFLDFSKAFDSNTKILSGRLYGGQAILYKKCIGDSVTKLDFKNNRLLGIHIKGRNGSNE